MSRLTLTFRVMIGIGLMEIIGHQVMCWPLRSNIELGEMNKRCQMKDNTTVYEEVQNMCLPCSNCHLDSKDDHCQTCRALGIIPGADDPGSDSPEEVVNNPGKRDDTEDGKAGDLKPPLSKDSSPDVYGMPVVLIIGVVSVCGGIFATTLVGLTWLKRRNSTGTGMLPVPQHDEASDGLPPEQETSPPDSVHPSRVLTNIQGFDYQELGINTETPV